MMEAQNNICLRVLIEIAESPGKVKHESPYHVIKFQASNLIASHLTTDNSSLVKIVGDYFWYDYHARLMQGSVFALHAPAAS